MQELDYDHPEEAFANTRTLPMCVLPQTGLPVMTDKRRAGNLSPKQRRFAEEYLIDQNATQSAIRAGYSPRTARSIGHRLLTKADIQKAVAERDRQIAARAGISAEQTVRELARIGFSRLSDVASWGPEGVILLASGDLSEEALAAVKKVVAIETAAGRHVLIEVHDKTRALDRLMRYFGLYDINQAPATDLWAIEEFPSDVLMRIILRAEAELARRGLSR